MNNLRGAEMNKYIIMIAVCLMLSTPVFAGEEIQLAAAIGAGSSTSAQPSGSAEAGSEAASASSTGTGAGEIGRAHV